MLCCIVIGVEAVESLVHIVIRASKLTCAIEMYMYSVCVIKNSDHCNSMMDRLISSA